ncbi:4Fe-4S dicluster domain-containing protein [Endozoicomonas ascidiicola]|uniref:4Fe-4S dicluster domain-containing protein n=1 Tax=Endozoicomonas ascidiicola TaxID=1698521 RepID=UPI000B01DF87|nr:reductive dehalogenase domain-containing protein [Endozoicomonas ascidiicola]
MSNIEHDEESVIASRRNFLKLGGLAAAGTTIGAAAGAGFVLGRDPDANVGWGRTEAGADQFFNRKPFEVDTPPTLKVVGKVERPEYEDYLFSRRRLIQKAIKDGWDVDSGYENFPDERIRKYYRRYPDRWPEMLQAFVEMGRRKENIDSVAERYSLAWAYGRSYLKGMYVANFPPVPVEHPDIADFAWVKGKPAEFKTPQHASDLVKKMAHKFGASIVGVTKLDPAFVFKNRMRMGGTDDNWDDSIPKHWKNIIVFGVPMNWDPMYAAAGYSTSYDGYFRAKTISGLLAAWLGEMGYAARPQFPGGDYETVLPPIAIQAGMGESARNGILVTPEVGPNIRLAAVITNLDIEPDKPVNLHIRAFCEDCKICADTCPSGSISKADKPDAVIRGFERFDFNQDSCYRFWCTAPTDSGMGCRVCIAVCPYTRKNNWIHTVVKEMDPRDPTGITRKALLAMQHNFFYYPTAEAFHPEWTGGNNAGYHEPPEWMRPENYLKVNKTWEYDGNWEGF